MADIRPERFIWLTLKGLRVDNSKREGAPFFGSDKASDSATKISGRKLMPSRELAAITGKAPLPRSQVISKVWDHIHKNNLQNPRDKREIMADSALKPIFGGKDRLSMFEMNKRLSEHLKEAPAKSLSSSKPSATHQRRTNRKSA